MPRWSRFYVGAVCAALVATVGGGACRSLRPADGPAPAQTIADADTVIARAAALKEELGNAPNRTRRTAQLVGGRLVVDKAGLGEELEEPSLGGLDPELVRAHQLCNVATSRAGDAKNDASRDPVAAGEALAEAQKLLAQAEEIAQRLLASRRGSRAKALKDRLRRCASRCRGDQPGLCWDPGAGTAGCVCTAGACKGVVVCVADSDCPAPEHYQSFHGCEKPEGRALPAPMKACHYETRAGPPSVETEERPVCGPHDFASGRCQASCEKGDDEACRSLCADYGPDECLGLCKRGHDVACEVFCKQRMEPAACAPLCRKGDERACQLMCSVGDKRQCDALCKSGLEAACAGASFEVQQAAEKAAAKRRQAAARAKLPGLFKTCEANRAVMVALKRKWAAAKRAADLQGVKEAEQEVAALQPKFEGTLAEMREAMEAAAGGDRDEFRKLVTSLKRRCSVPSWQGIY